MKKTSFLVALGSVELGQFSLEDTVPLVHAVDDVLVVLLSSALGDVALGPLAVAGGDLLDADGGVLTVVTIPDGVIVRSSLTGLGATVGKVLLVVVATSLVATLEVALHTAGVVAEFLNPSLSAVSWQEAEPVGQDLCGELVQPGQTLERVAWWDLLVLGGGNGKKNG